MCGDQPQDHLNPTARQAGTWIPTSWLVPASSNLGLLSQLPQNPVQYNSRTTPALGPWPLSHSYQPLALPTDRPAQTPGASGLPGQQPCAQPPTSRSARTGTLWAIQFSFFVLPLKAATTRPNSKTRSGGSRGLSHTPVLGTLQLTFTWLQTHTEAEKKDYVSVDIKS